MSIFVVAISVIAGIVLAIFANWLYDELRQRGSLPRSVTVRVMAIVSAAMLPFVFLAALPSMIANDTSGSSSRSATIAPVARSTRIIEFVPELPTASRAGHCWTSSLTLSRANAWRCMVEANQIFDPCFELVNPLGRDPAIVCGASPTHPNSGGFLLELTEPLPDPEKWAGALSNKDSSSAWILELTDDTNCTFSTGATAAYHGERLNYLCNAPDGLNAFIVGDPIAGETWRVFRVIVSASDHSVVRNEWIGVKRVWR